MAEEGEAVFRVPWVPLEAFLEDEAPLYPDGLLRMFTGHIS